MVGAERLAASVAVELIAARAEHLAACGIRTGADFEEGVAAVFVVLDWKALEQGVAGGAGGGGELLSHGLIMLDVSVHVKIIHIGIWHVMLFYGHLR